MPARGVADFAGAYMSEIKGGAVMHRLVSCRLLLAALVALMRLASVRDRRDRANAAAAMLARRVN
jgi:hypothetical protein